MRQHHWLCRKPDMEAVDVALIINEQMFCNNRLKQIGASFRSGVKSKRKAVFECICGVRVIACVTAVRRGRTKSCGCISKELLEQRCTTHGMSSTTLYRVWRSMHSRCSNAKQISFANYGQRGITVCQEWSSFERFVSDMGIPAPGMTIDRIDPNEGYSKQNCRWADWKTQQRNRRNNRIITYQGRSQCIAAWAEEFGMPTHSLHQRLKRGWSIDKALTTPLDRWGKANAQ